MEDFLGDECIAGVDLASRLDLTSRVMLFRRQMMGIDHFYCFSSHYLNQAAIEDNRNASYGGWVNDGWLSKTPGNVTDYGTVGDDLVADVQRFNGLIQCAYDPFHGDGLIQSIEKREDWPRRPGEFFVGVRQTVQNLSPAMKELEAVIISGRFHHDGNPVLTWEMANVVAFRDAKEKGRMYLTQPTDSI
jgi:phage terminase large subunit-like protein